MIGWIFSLLPGWLFASSTARRLRELYHVHPDPAREWPIYC
jgi:hypothetical protein